jgi:hypothetical protein
MPIVSPKNEFMQWKNDHVTKDILQLEKISFAARTLKQPEDSP